MDKKKDLNMEADALPEETGTETEGMGQAAVKLPGYQSQYTGQIQDLYQQHQSREPFSYDVNSDAMYEALKNQYISGGQMAMMDTMGQAATLTGGYGNSYAQGAGQQAYQQYLQGLNDQIPDLYGMALENYMAQGDQLMQQYGMLTDMDATEYGRYMDNMDMIQAQVLEMLRAGYRPSQEMIDASGLSQEYIDAMYPERGAGSSGMGLVESWWNWKAKQEGGSGGGGGQTYTPMYGDIMDAAMTTREQTGDTDMAIGVVDAAEASGYLDADKANAMRQALYNRYGEG